MGALPEKIGICCFSFPFRIFAFFLLVPSFLVYYYHSHFDPRSHLDRHYWTFPYRIIIHHQFRSFSHVSHAPKTQAGPRLIRTFAIQPGNQLRFTSHLAGDIRLIYVSSAAWNRDYVDTAVNRRWLAFGIIYQAVMQFPMRIWMFRRGH
jgi:hypothetical protein